MRYIVEIDPSTVAGAELIKYIKGLHAPVDSVKIHEASSLSDEEMALPGSKPRKEQLEEWLAQPDYGSMAGEKALGLLKVELAEYRNK